MAEGAYFTWNRDLDNLYSLEESRSRSKTLFHVKQNSMAIALDVRFTWNGDLDKLLLRLAPEPVPQSSH
jgi:hypothetical protein